MLGVTVNSSQAQIGLVMLKKKFEQEAPQAMLDIGYELMRLSQKEVPHDEGTLQNSGTVEPLKGDVVVGYHTKYAARLHEHPEYRFQKGRKGKYLEDPIRNNESTLGISYGRNLQMRLF